VALITQLNPDQLYDYLLADYLIQQSCIEEIKSNPARATRVGALIDVLCRGSPKVPECFKNALIKTGQSHLITLVDPTYIREVQAVQATDDVVIIQPSFQKLTDAVYAMKPRSKTSERSGQTFITSVDVFCDDLPHSELGIREIAYLIAYKSNQFGGEDCILSWKNAPTKADFKRQLAIYERELQEVANIFLQLENGGIHFCVNVKCEEVLKLLLVLKQRFCQVQENGLVTFCIPMLSLKTIPDVELQIAKCLFHLICFSSDFELIMRKTVPPRPNCYLVHRASGLVQSSQVILDRDRNWVYEVVVQDESVVLTNTCVANCPW
jgi:hypothetical protein